MAPTTPSDDPVLALGKQLVSELERPGAADTLTRWLAHVLAEKILAAETTEEDLRAAAHAEAIDLILKLWNHRRHFPNGIRPFEDLEALCKVILRLDPEDPTPRFFSLVEPGTPAGLTPEAKSWLERALTIDRAARAAIRYCLAAADESTAREARRWAGLARFSKVPAEDEISIVDLLEGLDADLIARVAPAVTASKKSIDDKLDQLRKAADEISNEIKSRSA